MSVLGVILAMLVLPTALVSTLCGSFGRVMTWTRPREVSRYLPTAHVVRHGVDAVARDTGDWLGRHAFGLFRLSLASAASLAATFVVGGVILAVARALIGH